MVGNERVGENSAQPTRMGGPQEKRRAPTVRRAGAGHCASVRYTRTEGRFFGVRDSKSRLQTRTDGREANSRETLFLLSYIDD